MSSSVPFIAFLLTEPDAPAARDVRLRHADRYVSRLMPEGFERTVVGDAAGGIVTWSHKGDEGLDWESISRTDDQAVAWIHVPGVGDRYAQRVTEYDLASAVLSGDVEPWSLPPPYAVARWRPGQVEVVNDLLGAVRLFHYSFPSGEVWTTRMGLAHLFMGEEPTKSRVAWAGMAAIGWAPAGTTQIGQGRQLEAGTRVAATQRGVEICVHTEDYFAPWFRHVRSGPAPEMDLQVQEMTTVLATARRWPERPVSDLSGGKDSRLIVALGLRAGLITRVRTIASERGEVETARALVARSSGLEHEVVDPPSTTHRPPSGLAPLMSRHIAWEGRYLLPPSAYSDETFSGFKRATHARLNGLGGGILGGGALAAGRWRERLEGAPPSEAAVRHRALAQLSPGSDEARETAATALDAWIPRAQELGVTTALGVVDLVHMLDRVPHWSNTFATTSILCPFFAPSVLAQGARAVGAGAAATPPHADFIARAYPAWSGVPFYKASGAKVQRPRIWETSAWPWVRETLDTGLESVESFSPSEIQHVTRTAGSGTAGKAVEVAIQRALWELSFDLYLRQLTSEVQAMRRELVRARRSRLDRVVRAVTRRGPGEYPWVR